LRNCGGRIQLIHGRIPRYDETATTDEKRV
jgi:hypothetical protein